MGVHRCTVVPYRGTSLRRKHLPLGPYSRPMPGVTWGSWRDGLFLISEAPLHFAPHNKK